MGKHTAGPWIGKPTGCGGQGLIYSEKNGRNVAVAYDERDTDLIASAPDLVTALQMILDSEETTLGDGGSIIGKDYRVYAENAIAAAEGR